MAAFLALRLRPNQRYSPHRDPCPRAPSGPRRRNPCLSNPACRLLGGRPPSGTDRGSSSHQSQKFAICVCCFCCNNFSSNPNFFYLGYFFFHHARTIYYLHSEPFVVVVGITLFLPQTSTSFALLKFRRPNLTCFQPVCQVRQKLNHY